jgi:hypothetical protein
MALQSLLAKAGLRSSTLGSLASLALAFPLSEGDPSVAAHTAASRTGFYGVAGTKVATVVNGTEALSVLATGVSIPGALTVAGVTYTWPGANAVGALTNNGAGVLSWTPVAIIGATIQAPQIAFASGPNTLTGDPNLVYTGTQIGLGTATPAAKLDIVGLDLATSANNAVASVFAHATLSKNDANVRQFFGTLYKPVLNTGGSNLNTTYNVLQVDTVNTGLTGLTVNLLNLAFGGVSRFNVASGGAVTVPSTSLSIGGVTYVWPALQGAAAAMFQNDGSGNLAWNVMSGDATLSSVGVLTLASVITAGGPIGSTSTTPVITWDAKGRLTAVTSATITPASIGAIGGTIAAPQVAFGSGTNTINGDANFVYTGAQLGLGNPSPTTKLDIIGNDLAAAADGAVANIFAHTTLTKNTNTTRTFYGSLYKPTFNTGGSNTTTTYNILATDSVNTSVTGLTVNLLNLSFGGVNAFLVDSTGKTTLPRSGTGTGDYTLALTGTPVANATSSQIRLGNALVGGNAAANGGTYFGINIPSAGAGSAADIEHFQINGVSAFRIQSNAFVRINNTTDDATGAAQLSITNVGTVGSAPCMFVDNGNDTTASSNAIVVRTKGNTGNSRVFCVRNLDHAAQFAFIIGSLGAMAWGTGDGARDVGLSRSTTVANALVTDGQGNPGNFLVTGQLGVQTGALNATAAMSMTATNLSTAADLSPAMMAISGTTISKNDTNTRTFYGIRVLPTINPGASNTNTTFNVLQLDTVNTTTTGVTTNLINCAYGGSNFFTLRGNNSGALVFGPASTASANVSFAIALGNQAQVTGTASTNVAIGDNVIAGNGGGSTNSWCFAVGLRNTSNGAQAHTYGSFLTSSGASSFTIGTGISDPSRLINTTKGAYMFGWNATTPTVYARGGGSYTGTGTVATSTVTNIVTGTGSKFTNDYVIGDRITVGANTYTVTGVTNDTSLTISTNGAATVSGQAHTVLEAIFKLFDGSGNTKMFMSDTGLVALGTNNTLPVAQLDIIGQDLATAADQSVASIFVHTTLSKNDTNTRTFYGNLLKPTFNTGASNTTTTYNILATDSINTSVTGLTVNLINLSFGGTSQFKIASNGASTFTSRSMTIGTVPYVWPASQGAASTFLQNDGAGNLSWVTSSGTIGGSIATNQIAYGSGANTIQGSANLTYDGTRAILAGTISSGNLLAVNATSSGTTTALNMALANSGGTSQTGLGVSFSSATASPTIIGIDMAINNGSSPTTVYAFRFQPAGSLGSLVTSYFLYQTNRVFASYLQGALTVEHDQGASDPQLRVQGTWFTAGTATTNKPQLLVEPLAATSTGWSTAGTGFGVNAATGFAGNLLDLQLNGVSKVSVLATGATTIVSTSLNIGTVTYVWPSSQGGANTFLKNDGAGNLSWAAASSTPGGSTTQIQYNNAGAFGGIAGFTYTPAGTATFDLNMTRTYTGTPTGTIKYGTLISTLSVTPTTTASGGTGYAVRGVLSIDNVTGLASTLGTQVAMEASLTDASIVGGSWLGTTIGFRSTSDRATGGSLAGSFSATGGPFNTTAVSASVSKAYTGAATNYSIFSGSLSLSATGTVTNAYGLDISSIVVSSGAITTAYGIHIGTISGSGISNAYGIYQADTGAQNFFGGIMGVGNATPSTSTAFIVPASTTGVSSLRIPHGTAPSVPVDGDVWTTTTAMFVRINGSTVQLGSGGGTIGGSITAGQVAFGAVTSNQIAGSSNFTWSNSTNSLLIQAPGFTASSGITRVNGTFTGSAGNHYMSGLTVTLDNAQTGGSNNSIDGILTNISCTGSGTSNNSVNGFRTIVSIPTGQNTGQVTLFNGSLTTNSGSTFSIVYGSNLTGSVDGTIGSFIGYEMAATVFSTGLSKAIGYGEDLSTSGAGATITDMRGFASNAIVSSGDTVTNLVSFYAGPQLAGNATNFYGAYLAPNVTSGTVTNLYGVYIAPQNTGTVTNLFGIYQAGANVLNQFEGPLLSSLSPVASQVAGLFNGVWFSGGDSTTTKPLVLIEPSGTPSANWNTGGTAFGINANISFAGNLADFQVNGASYFRVDNLGSAIVSRLADARVGDVSSSWTDGGSQVLQDNSWTIINTNTGTITSFTLFLSPNPIDGEQCIIVSRGTVTTFTLDGNGHTVDNAPGTLLAGTSVAFEFFSGVWCRLY